MDRICRRPYSVNCLARPGAVQNQVSHQHFQQEPRLRADVRGGEAGFHGARGLEGQVVVVRGADKSLAALIGGSVYVSASGTDAHIAAVERGVDLSLIGGTINGLSQVIMAPKNYKTLNDLRGATIGATSATSGLGVALRRYMKAKGFELGRDYQILATGSAGPTLAALTAGQVQAAALGVPLNFVAADQGYNAVGRI
ncbi:MAG TPA: PhnD/SsuA/transferrin family substrate-binding protein, partial [Candidatus Binatia bacterium]|nr:PhnD/SsuA/transferrin family substrate-binding protein [Candidatus Binatia bacterium]